MLIKLANNLIPDSVFWAVYTIQGVSEMSLETVTLDRTYKSSTHYL